MKLGEIVRLVQGHFLHEAWSEAYGRTLGDDERETVHLRSASALLDAAGPLDVERPPATRVVTNCRGFAVVTVALLRAEGVEARARCGFGTYFKPGWFEDHWVVEYRDGPTWRMADAQIDEVQRAALGIGFDLLDMPAGQFVTGPEAWRLGRSGTVPFERFGLNNTDMAGDWFVAGNVVRDRVAVDHDVAALPWDVWEPMVEPGEPMDPALFDRIADGSAPVPRPAKVYNTRRGRLEELSTEVTARP